MYLKDPVPEHVAAWATLIGFVIAVVLLALYIITVNHTTSDKRLQQLERR